MPLLLLLSLVLSTFPLFFGMNVGTVKANDPTILYFVPITVNNTQSASTVADLPVLLEVNMSLYSSYINSTQPQNIVFYNASNYQENAWLENYTTTASGNSTVWVQIHETIPANTAATFYMGMYDKSVNNFDATGNWGESASLSSTYGQYDNGKTVFTLYDNFNGTSLNSTMWSTAAKGSSSYAVNNKLTLTTSAGNDVMHVYTNTTLADTGQYMAEANWTSLSTSSQGACLAWLTDVPTTTGGDNGFHNGYRFEYMGGFSGQWWIQKEVSGSGSTLSSSYSSATTTAIIGAYWSSASPYEQLFREYSQKETSTDNTLAVTNAYLDLAGLECYGSGSQVVNWARVRVVPPNNVMPTITFGAGQTPAPAYSNIAVNNTYANHPALFSCYWTGTNTLSGFIFSTNNSGAWANDTWSSLSGTSSWANVTKTLNTTVGQVVGYRWYCNDSTNTWGDTGIQILTTAQVYPTYSNVGTNNNASGKATIFSTQWADTFGLSGFIFSTNNTGPWVNDSWSSLSANPSWANVTKTLNSTTGLTIGYRWYCNNSDNSWNDTGIHTFLDSLNLNLTRVDITQGLAGGGTWLDARPVMLDNGSRYIIIRDTNTPPQVWSAYANWTQNTLLNNSAPHSYGGCYVFYLDNLWTDTVIVTSFQYIATYNFTSNTWADASVTGSPTLWAATHFASYSNVTGKIYITNWQGQGWTQPAQVAVTTPANLLNPSAWDLHTLPSNHCGYGYSTLFNGSLYILNVYKDVGTGRNEYAYQVVKMNLGDNSFTVLVDNSSNTNNMIGTDDQYGTISSNSTTICYSVAVQNGTDFYWQLYYSNDGGTSWTKIEDLPRVGSLAQHEELNLMIYPYQGNFLIGNIQDWNSTSYLAVINSSGNVLWQYTGLQDQFYWTPLNLWDGTTYVMSGEGGYATDEAQIKLLSSTSGQYQQYNLTIGSSTNGVANLTAGTYAYNDGTVVPVLATPNNNYAFLNWVLDSSNYTSNPISVTMSSNHTLTPYFSLIQYYLNVTVGTPTYGTVNQTSGWITNGSTVAILATPNSGYQFWNWNVDGVSNTSNPLSVVMDANHTVIAYFAPLTSSVSFGAITGNGTYAGHGVTYSCTITSASGYIASWNNTGTWVNGTWTAGGAGTLTGVHNSTVGYVVSVVFYANDSSNIWGTSTQYNFTLTDGDAPTVSNIGSNATTANSTCLFYSHWTDNVALSGFIFSTNNSGAWANDTWTSGFSSGWANVTKTLNMTAGAAIQWKVYANDTSDNWNATATQSLTTTPLSSTVSCFTIIGGYSPSWNDINGYLTFTAEGGTATVTSSCGFWLPFTVSVNGATWTDWSFDGTTITLNNLPAGAIVIIDFTVSSEQPGGGGGAPGGGGGGGGGGTTPTPPTNGTTPPTNATTPPPNATTPGGGGTTGGGAGGIPSLPTIQIPGLPPIAQQGAIWLILIILLAALLGSMRRREPRGRTLNVRKNRRKVLKVKRR